MTRPAPAVRRPRVAGDREHEILEACVEELLEVGYDRLTMDGVAQRARAGKATLYRRWNSKLSLVIDALKHTKGVPEVPDTGSLRGDHFRRARHSFHSTPGAASTGWRSRQGVTSTATPVCRSIFHAA